MAPCALAHGPESPQARKHASPQARKAHKHASTEARFASSRIRHDSEVRALATHASMHARLHACMRSQTCAGAFPQPCTPGHECARSPICAMPLQVQTCMSSTHVALKAERSKHSRAKGRCRSAPSSFRCSRAQRAEALCPSRSTGAAKGRSRVRGRLPPQHACCQAEARPKPGRLTSIGRPCAAGCCPNRQPARVPGARVRPGTQRLHTAKPHFVPQPLPTNPDLSFSRRLLAHATSSPACGRPRAAQPRALHRMSFSRAAHTRTPACRPHAHANTVPARARAHTPMHRPCTRARAPSASAARRPSSPIM